MGKENIFIHIPKTGGTSLITAVQNTYWTTEPNFYYRHIEGKSKKSNAGDIFDPANFSKYANYNVFMMVREPVDRVISEYYYLRERRNFMNLLNRPPADFEDFIKNPQTHNYMVGFLAGKRIYDTRHATVNDLDRVIQGIEKIPVRTGIFEYFEETLHYFRKITGIDWGKVIEVKRMTFSRPAPAEISDKLKNLILEKNHLDKKLYDYCLDKFMGIRKEITGGKILFTKNKYNHIIPYAMQICLFEFCTENKFFLKTHITYFKELTFYILNQLKVRDGKVFAMIWNATFLNTIKLSHPGSSFYTAMDEAYKSTCEPLEQTVRLGKTIDLYLNNNKGTSNYYQPLKFDKRHIIRPIEQKTVLRSLFNFLKK